MRWLAPSAVAPPPMNRGFAFIEHKELTNMQPKNTICLWFNNDAHEAARFYAAPFRIAK